MPIGLEGLAAGLQNLQKINKDLQKSHDEQRQLQLELLRSAPPGYVPQQTQGAFGPEYNLQYVGMQDPRVQFQMQQAQQQQQVEIAGRVALEKALNPILAERGAAERQLLEDSQIRQAKALDGLRAEAEFAGQVKGTDFAALPGMVPEARQATLAKALQAFGQLQALDPGRAQRAVAALPPDAQQYFGGGQPQPGSGPGQAPAGPAQGQSVGAPAQVPTDRGFTPGPETGAAYPMRRQQAAQVPSQNERPAPAQTEAASAANSAGPLSIEDLSGYVTAQQQAGVSDAQIRDQAIGKLRQSYGGRLQPGAIADAVDKAIRTRVEAAQEQRNIRRAKAEDVGLTSEQARFEQPVFESELAVPQGAQTDDDPYYVGKGPALDKSGKPIKDAAPVDRVQVNANAIVRTAEGDAVPLSKIRSQLQNQGVEPAVGAELAARPWGAAAQRNLQAVEARPITPDVMTMTPAGLEAGEDGTIRLRTKLQLPSETPISDFFFGDLDIGGAQPRHPNKPEQASAAMSPQGVAENLWMSALANRPSARFVFVQGTVPPALADQARARNAAAVSRMREAGIKVPNFKAGFWIDVEQLVGALPLQPKE